MMLRLRRGCSVFRWQAPWIAVAALGLAVPRAAAVNIVSVTVGDPGNAADTRVMNDGTTDYGSVPYVYRIGRFEVTNAEYAEFLNAVAGSDPNELYNPKMESSPYGGIVQRGSSPNFVYSVKSGMAAIPVVFVSFYDALRFANWLQNGQPDGAQVQF